MAMVTTLTAIVAIAVVTKGLTGAMFASVGREECVGSGHATLGLRQDWRAHLLRAHLDIGFQHVRFHGILDDGART
jgi:hypothetical protein